MTDSGFKHSSFGVQSHDSHKLQLSRWEPLSITEIQEAAPLAPYAKTVQRDIVTFACDAQGILLAARTDMFRDVASLPTHCSYLPLH